MRRIFTFIILLTFVGCASFTSMGTLEKYKADKNYRGIISACGESETLSGKPDEKMKSNAFNFILSNKNEAKQHVIDAISNGSGSLRQGGVDIAFKWPDRDFIEPLFKAYADEDSSSDSAKMMRMSIAISWGAYSSVLKDKEKKDMALKIAATLKDENNVQVLHPIVKAIKEFAVPEAYNDLVVFNVEVFIKKSRKLDSIGGARGGRAYLSMINSNILEVLKVMVKDDSEKVNGKKN